MQNFAAIVEKYDELGVRDKQMLSQMLTPKMVKYMIHAPTPKQAAFLLLNNREAFYGGAAGGGKSDALLMGGLQYTDVPGYAGIIFRRTYKDLTLPGALLDRASAWLAGFKDVKWDDKESTYRFMLPNNQTSSLSFGYLENDNDRYRYQSSEFQFVGFDELTQISEVCYKYLFSRLRRLKGFKVPLRVRSASNPGGRGHEWVRQRFIVEGAAKGRVFIPASLEDNPFLDEVEYDAALGELDPITREQLRHGNWNISITGAMFKRHWFNIVGNAPRNCTWIRYWDLAATAAKDANDPDYLVGMLVGRSSGPTGGNFYIADIRRERLSPGEVEALIRQTAMVDKAKYGSVRIFMEQEPGASGKLVIDTFARKVLSGFPFWGNRSSGDKVTRALPVSSTAEQGRVHIVQGPWIAPFLDEMEIFPMGKHDDQVDALSGAIEMFSKLPYYEGGIIEVLRDESYWSDSGFGGSVGFGGPGHFDSY